MPRGKATGLEMYLSMSKALGATCDKLAERYDGEDEVIEEVRNAIRAVIRKNVASMMESELGMKVVDVSENAEVNDE